MLIFTYNNNFVTEMGVLFYNNIFLKKKKKTIFFKYIYIDLRNMLNI